MFTEKDCLQLLIYRIWIYRVLQQKYWAGDKKLFKQMMDAGEKLDNAIRYLTDKLGYSMDDIQSKFTQQKMF